MEYSVSGFDPASSDRFFIYDVEPNKEAWVEWATGTNIPEECINFFIKTDEIHDYANNPEIPSYRKWTKFFRSISNIPDFKDSTTTNIIHEFGLGSIGNDMTRLFYKFIDNELGKIPSLKFIFNPKNRLDAVINTLKTAIYTTDSNSNQNIVRNDMKGLIGLRLRSYLRTRSSTDMTDDFINRFINLVTSSILPKDTLLMLLNDIHDRNNPHPNYKKLNEKFTLNDKIMDIIINNNIK